MNKGTGATGKDWPEPSMSCIYMPSYPNKDNHTIMALLNGRLDRFIVVWTIWISISFYLHCEQAYYKTLWHGMQERLDHREFHPY